MASTLPFRAPRQCNLELCQVSVRLQGRAPAPECCARKLTLPSETCSCLRCCLRCCGPLTPLRVQQRLPGSGAQRSTQTRREPSSSSLARRHFLPSHAAPPAALSDVPAAWRWLLLRCLDGRRRGRRCVGPSGGRTAMQVRRTRERRAAFLMGSHTARSPLLAPCAEHRARLRMRSRDAALQTHTARLAPGLRYAASGSAQQQQPLRTAGAAESEKSAAAERAGATPRDAPACAPLVMRGERTPRRADPCRSARR
jgi:hypothetical protein